MLSSIKTTSFFYLPTAHAEKLIKWVFIAQQNVYVLRVMRFPYENGGMQNVSDLNYYFLPIIPFHKIKPHLTCNRRGLTKCGFAWVQ